MKKVSNNLFRWLFEITSQGSGLIVRTTKLSLRNDSKIFNAKANLSSKWYIISVWQFAAFNEFFQSLHFSVSCGLPQRFMSPETSETCNLCWLMSVVAVMVLVAWRISTGSDIYCKNRQTNTCGKKIHLEEGDAHLWVSATFPSTKSVLEEEDLLI